MIINTGQRTDIPAFYSEWFFNRVREGFVMTRNPYDPRRISRYKLDPETVDAICFCSKNPAPMIPRLSELSAFRQYWHVTITPYGRDIEPFVPPKEEVMSIKIRLVKREQVKLYHKILSPVISIVIAFVFIAIILRAMGYNPATAYQFLFKGAFGNAYNFSETLVQATPLLFAGLGVAVALSM